MTYHRPLPDDLMWPDSEQLPVSEVGFSFTVFIPAAFVALPIGSFDGLPLRARRRIVTAGAFHNFICWVGMAISERVRLARLAYSLIGYRDVTSLGRVVIDVDPVCSIFW